MSRLYDTIEPSVIDEQMLKDAVEEQGPKSEAGRIAKQEGIDFGDVLSLRLDFKSRCLLFLPTKISCAELGDWFILFNEDLYVFFFSQRYFKNRQFMELCQLDEVANG